MKKALQISIARTLFTIEEDAYAKLSDYLLSIKNHFEKTEGKEEIISDIESRVAEQFGEMKTGIITVENVDAIIASMGKVGDFGDEAPESNSSENSGGSSAGAGAGTGAGSSQTQKNKKFYRNPEDKILMGVCSGLAKYFNVDVLWVRIAFILLSIFTHGFGLFLYIVLAIITPEAKTASQKLEMEGSEVTLSTISKNMKEKAEEIRTKHGSSLNRVLSVPFIILKKFVTIITNILGPIARTLIGAFVAIMSIGGIIALSVIGPLILTNGSTYAGFPLEQAISNSHLYLAVISAYLALGIPLLVIFLLALTILKKKNLFTARLGIILLIVWCLATASAGVTIFNGTMKIHDMMETSPIYGTITKEVEITGAIHELSALDGTRVTYVQGKKPSLTLTGRADVVNSFKTETDGSKLILQKNFTERRCLFCNLGSVQARVTLPFVSSISAEQGSNIEADRWTSTTSVSVLVSQGSNGDVSIYAPTVTATAEQGSSLSIAGTSTTATLLATQGSFINAQSATSTHMNATAREGSHILRESIAHEMQDMWDEN